MTAKNKLYKVDTKIMTTKLSQIANYITLVENGLTIDIPLYTFNEQYWKYTQKKYLERSTQAICTTVIPLIKGNFDLIESCTIFSTKLFLSPCCSKRNVKNYKDSKISYVVPLKIAG